MSGALGTGELGALKSKPQLKAEFHTEQTESDLSGGDIALIANSFPPSEAPLCGSDCGALECPSCRQETFRASQDTCGAVEAAGAVSPGTKRCFAHCCDPVLLIPTPAANSFHPLEVWEQLAQGLSVTKPVPRTGGNCLTCVCCKPSGELCAHFENHGMVWGWKRP